MNPSPSHIIKQLKATENSVLQKKRSLQPKKMLSLRRNWDDRFLDSEMIPEVDETLCKKSDLIKIQRMRRRETK
jgi:hypothetical protein